MPDQTPAPLEDVANLREVVESQAALNHRMTIVPNDVLLRLLDRIDAARAGYATPEYMVCPRCDGDGWTAETTADPDEDGELGEPYQYQRGCDTCGGVGSLARAGSATSENPSERTLDALSLAARTLRKCDAHQHTNVLLDIESSYAAAILAESEAQAGSATLLREAREAFTRIDRECGWPEMHGKEFANALAALRAALKADTGTPGADR